MLAEAVVTPGQVSDCDPAEALVEGRAGEAVIAGRGHDADRVVDRIERQGSKPVIPPRKRRCTKPGAVDAKLHRGRHRIEFFVSRPKQLRRAATRRDKTARNRLAMAQIGCIRIRARFEDAPQAETGIKAGYQSAGTRRSAPCGARGGGR